MARPFLFRWRQRCTWGALLLYGLYGLILVRSGGHKRPPRSRETATGLTLSLRGSGAVRKNSSPLKTIARLPDTTTITSAGQSLANSDWLLTGCCGRGVRLKTGACYQVSFLILLKIEHARWERFLLHKYCRR